VVYTVRSDIGASITLLENDPVSSILQNIHLLLNTRKGTVPFMRDFGLPMEYKDKPLQLAKAILTAEATEAVSIYEPRVKKIKMRLEPSLTSPGQFVAVAEVTI